MDEKNRNIMYDHPDYPEHKDEADDDGGEEDDKKENSHVVTNIALKAHLMMIREALP